MLFRSGFVDMVHKENRKSIFLVYERDPKNNTRLLWKFRTNCERTDRSDECRLGLPIRFPSFNLGKKPLQQAGPFRWDTVGVNGTTAHELGTLYAIFAKDFSGEVDFALFEDTTATLTQDGKSPKSYWDHTLVTTYRSSNLILFKTQNDTHHIFTHLALESSATTKEFCHPSCYKVFGCDKPFVVCKSQQKWITIGIFITSFLTLLLLLCIVNKLFDRTERQLNKYEDKKSKNYNRALEKASVDPENKVIHFRYSKMTPSMIEAVDAKIHQEVEDDEEEQHGSLLRIPKFNLRKGSGDKDKEGSGSTPKSIKEPGQLKSPQERSQVHHRSKSPNQSPASMKPSLKKPLLKES